MKRIATLFMSLMLMVAFASATDITVNSTVTEDITISAAGDYHFIGDGTQSKYKVVVAENLGNVTIVTSNVKIYAETSRGAALQVGAGTTVTLKIDGTNHYQGKSSANAGIEVLGNVVIESLNGTRSDSLYTQGSDAPGIGVGNDGTVGGNITINSGVVYAKSASKAAGIGNSGAKQCRLGTITINGGYVYGDATGAGNHSAGIGSGYYISATKQNTEWLAYQGIVINGGVVWAKGYSESAAIGCSKYLNGGDITINGGTITPVQTNSSYKGIGGPDTYFTGKVTINGGSINGTAKNPVNAAGTAVEQFVATTDPNAQVFKGSVTGTGYSVVLGTDYGITDVFGDAEGKVYLYIPATPSDVVANIINPFSVDLTQAVNITAAGKYIVKGNGSQTTNGIVVAADLGDVVLNVTDVNVAATTALQIGANTNVILNGGNMALTGALTGAGTLTINGGTHKFQGAQSLGKVVITGGSVQTLNAGGTVEGWTNAVNAEGKALALFAGNFDNKANTKIINGTITGTDYSFDLKASYGLTDVYTSENGGLWFYVPSPIPSDAVGAYNLLVEIDLVENGSNELVITSAGKYQLNGDGSTQTKGMVTVAENAGDVVITLNNVNIKAKYGIKISTGNNVTLKLVGTNTVKAGTTYNSGIIVEGNLTIEGPGKLIAGGSTGSAIGGQHQGSTVGNITINGGVIEATGSTYGAAIGLAYVGKNPNNAVITVNGGTIWAKAGTGKCALGKSDTSSSMNVVINGGSVYALSSSGEEVELSKVTNKNEESVVLFKAQLEGATEATRVYSGSIDDLVLGGTGYGMNDVYTDASGYLYFYIPQPSESPKVVLSTTPTEDPEQPVLSTNANLKSIKVNDTDVAEFSATKLDYAFELPAGTTAIAVVTCEVEDAKATAVVDEVTSNTQKVNIVVTAEDGTTKKTYSVQLSVAQNVDPQPGKSTNANLKSIQVNGTDVADFSASTLAYSFELPEGTTELATVTCEVEDATATAVVDEVTSNTQKVNIVVTAEDGATKKTYTVHLSVAKPNIPVEPKDSSYILIDTDVATDITLSAGGRYLIFNDFFNVTNVPIKVASNVADTVFVTIQDIAIKPESEGSAMVVGAGSTVVLTLAGEEEMSLEGKSTGCGIEVLGNLIIETSSEDAALLCKGSGRAAGMGTTGKTEVAGTITINGGIVTAKSGSESAGIGAANAGKFGKVTINGGFVTAKGGAYSSGIGGSYVSKGTDTITINGGTVIAQSGYYCSSRAIGKGNGTHSGKVTTIINGGSIMALGEKGENDGIIDPTPNNGSYDVEYYKYTLEGHENEAVTSGHIGEYVLGSEYGINDVYTDENGDLHFWLPEGLHKAEVVINGIKLQGGDGPDNPGDTTIVDDPRMIDTDVATYIEINEGGQWTVFNDEFRKTSVAVKINGHIADTVYVDLRDVNIEPRSGSALIVGDSTTVVLTITGAGANLKGKTKGCGIEVLGTVIIEAANDTATLVCEGSGYAAGIGTTDSTRVAGDIIINSGNITVKCGNESAAIGAAHGGRLGNVTVNGGKVTATGGAYSAGIGGSYISKGNSTIQFNGGTVVARSGYYNSNTAVGKTGTHSGTVNVVVKGGSLLAQTEKGEESGVIKPTPNNEYSDVQVYKYVVNGEESTLVTEGHIKCCVLGKDYGINDVYTNENGAVYFYLPADVADNAEVVINNVTVQNGQTCGSAVEDVRENGINVVVTEDGIMVVGTNGAYTVVADVTGKTIMSGSLADDQLINVTPGMYVIYVANIGSTKIFVQ